MSMYILCTYKASQDILKSDCNCQYLVAHGFAIHSCNDLCEIYNLDKNAVIHHNFYNASPYNGVLKNTFFS